MDLSRRDALQGAAGLLLGSGLLAGCADSRAATTHHSLRLPSDGWEYDATNDVYYQLGCYYAATPAAPAYENLGVYVPGKFLDATKNSSGKYTATINRTQKVGSFTALTAPIVLPVNTPGYAAQQPPTSYSYSDVSTYLKAGFIYVAAGLRGRDSETSTFKGNAPWGVTDLKAAIRYLRYNAARIPGDIQRIFVFGMSGGGAQSAVAGASGDSTLYTPYLESIGAALKDSGGHAISDAVAGAMCWCPITSLDWSNGAYEWNLGQFATSGTRASGTWTKAYSDDLAVAFAQYVNQLGLKDSTGRALTLKRSSSGRYLAGTYYDHLLAVITTSLNHFLSYTTFPYTYSGSTGGGGGGGGGGTGGPPSGSAPGGSGTSGASSAMKAAAGTTTTASSSKTFKTIAAYIAYLNSTTHWVDYDSTTKKATVTNLEGFIESQKPATKDAGAFDGIARGETENLVFGHGTSALHFAPESYSVIAAGQSRYRKYSDWKSAYAASAYRSDFAERDTVGKNQLYRGNMYNPMYFLSKYYAGHRTATVAPHWRIRTGIAQGDTANTVEVNLALALQNYGVRHIDFETVWAEGHTMAEEANGNPESNFVAWVKRSVG